MAWRKSSRSLPGNECVEVRQETNTVYVRDSKNPDGPVLTFGGSSWRRFMETIKSGDLFGRLDGPKKSRASLLPKLPPRPPTQR